VPNTPALSLSPLGQEEPVPSPVTPLLPYAEEEEDEEEDEEEKIRCLLEQVILLWVECPCLGVFDMQGAYLAASYGTGD
jgi:hypothetical protein